MKYLYEIPAIPQVDKNLLEHCRDVINAIDPLAEIILYGSRARGDAKPDSDYDLLILTDGEVSLSQEDYYRRQLYPIELDSGAVLTVILTGKKDWNSPLYNVMPLYQNVRREGVHL